MKAAVYLDGGGIKVVDVDVPELLPGWVRVSVAAVGLCGTDKHIRHGALGSPAGVRPGHEIAGVIEAAGDDSHFAQGTLVAVEPVFGCGHCQFCATGRPNLCARQKFIGHSLPGGLADLVAVPAANLCPMPANLPPDVAALCEPMAVCVRGVSRAKVGVGSRVAVIGAGSIGLLSVLAARAAGAEEVFCTARYPHQREVAVHFGATRVYASADKLLEDLGDQYVNVVIETVGGAAGTLEESVSIASAGATIVVLGAFTGNPEIPVLRMVLNEISLITSHCHGQESNLSDLEVAADLVVRSLDMLPAMVTHKFKLDQVERAFAVLEDKGSQSIKVQLSP